MWYLEALGPLIHVSRVAKACKPYYHECDQEILTPTVSIGINATTPTCGLVLGLYATSKVTNIHAGRDDVAGKWVGHDAGEDEHIIISHTHSIHGSS